jgi:hypothetical protein
MAGAGGFDGRIGAEILEQLDGVAASRALPATAAVSNCPPF